MSYSVNDQRINPVVYVNVKELNKPMEFLLSVSPSKDGRPHESKRKSWTSVGIEPTTYGFDRPLLYRLNYETRREEVKSWMITVNVTGEGCK